MTDGKIMCNRASDPSVIEAAKKKYEEFKRASKSSSSTREAWGSGLQRSREEEAGASPGCFIHQQQHNFVCHDCQHECV